MNNQIQPNIDMTKRALVTSSNLMLSHVNNVDSGKTTMQGQKIYSVDDFAGVIKQKYPTYQSADNINLVHKFLAKYPSYQGRVDFSQGGDNAENAQMKAEADKQNTTSAIARETVKGTAKSLIGGAGKFISSAVAAVPDAVLSMFGKGPLNVSKTGTYQEDIAKTTGQVFDSAASGNPDTNASLAGKALGATADVVSGGADVLGLEALGEQGVKLASKVGELLPNMSKDAAKEALDVVSPKLTTKETEAALAQGRGQGGGLFSKTKILPDTRTKQVAQAVTGIVKKGATGAENISRVRSALETEAENLKTQIKSVDHPYTFKELSSKMNSIPEPISIKGTAFERQIGVVKKAALDIAKKSGGNVSNLLDARKEFDALVEKEYPNLYDRENAPMRNAITGIRNAMNDFIEENLPDDVKFKDSLKKQSLYYDAIDNISGNSAIETKTTGFQRATSAIKKHPVGALVTGAATGEGIRKITTGSF